MMKKNNRFIVTSFIPKNKEEKEEYLYWNMDDIPKNNPKFNLDFYKKNEKLMINFFKKLYILNNNYATVYLKPISRNHKYNYLYYERKNFWIKMKKLSFEQLFLNKEIKICNMKDFSFYIKFGYRDKDINQGIKILFDKLKIEIESTGEYSYLITVYDNSELKEFFESVQNFM